MENMVWPMQESNATGSGEWNAKANSQSADTPLKPG